MSAPLPSSALPAPSSLRAQVEEILAARVVAGEYEPGDMLTAPTLAGEFGVSATPVREALLALERRGFLAPVRNKGFRVTATTLEELEQIAYVRTLLECPPLKDLAGNLDEAAIGSLRVKADEIVASAKERRLRDYLAADTAFHMELIDLAENTYLSQTVRELRGRTRLSGLTSLAERGELQHTAAEHHAMLELLVEGKGDEAAALLAKHIGHVAGVWSGVDEA